MIESFSCKETEKIFHGNHSRKFPRTIQSRAQRKLVMLHAAAKLDDVRVPPSNHLEKLKGERNKYSIRVNNQWRICFTWKSGSATSVEIVDYHK